MTIASERQTKGKDVIASTGDWEVAGHLGKNSFVKGIK